MVGDKSSSHKDLVEGDSELIEPAQTGLEQTDTDMGSSNCNFEVVCADTAILKEDLDSEKLEQLNKMDIHGSGGSDEQAITPTKSTDPQSTLSDPESILVSESDHELVDLTKRAGNLGSINLNTYSLPELATLRVRPHGTLPNSESDLEELDKLSDVIMSPTKLSRSVSTKIQHANPTTPSTPTLETDPKRIQRTLIRSNSRNYTPPSTRPLTIGVGGGVTVKALVESINKDDEMLTQVQLSDAYVKLVNDYNAKEEELRRSIEKYNEDVNAFIQEKKRLIIDHNKQLDTLIHNSTNKDIPGISNNPMDEKFQAYEHQIKMLTSNLEEEKIRASALTSETESQNEKLEQLVLDKIKLMEELETSQTNLTSQYEINNKLVNENDTIKEKLRQSEANKIELNLKVDQLSVELETLSSSLVKPARDGDVSDNTTECQLLSNKCDVLESENYELTTRVHELVDSVESITRNLEIQCEVVKNLNIERDLLKESSYQLEETKIELESKINELLFKKDIIMDKLEDQYGVVISLKEENQLLKDKLAQHESANSDEISPKSISLDNTLLLNNLEQLIEDKSELSLKVHQLSLEIEALTENSETKEDLKKLEIVDTCEKLAKELDIKCILYNELDAEFKQLKKEYLNLNYNYTLAKDQFTHELKNSASDLEKLEAENEELSFTNELLKNSLGTLKSTIAAMETEFVSSKLPTNQLQEITKTENMEQGIEHERIQQTLIAKSLLKSSVQDDAEEEEEEEEVLLKTKTIEQANKSLIIENGNLVNEIMELKKHSSSLLESNNAFELEMANYEALEFEHNLLKRKLDEVTTENLTNVSQLKSTVFNNTVQACKESLMLFIQELGNRLLLMTQISTDLNSNAFLFTQEGYSKYPLAYTQFIEASVLLNLNDNLLRPFAKYISQIKNTTNSQSTEIIAIKDEGNKTISLLKQKIYIKEEEIKSHAQDASKAIDRYNQELINKENEISVIKQNFNDNVEKYTALLSEITHEKDTIQSLHTQLVQDMEITKLNHEAAMNGQKTFYQDIETDMKETISNLEKELDNVRKQGELLAVKSGQDIIEAKAQLSVLEKNTDNLTQLMNYKLDIYKIYAQLWLDNLSYTSEDQALSIDSKQSIIHFKVIQQADMIERLINLLVKEKESIDLESAGDTRNSLKDAEFIHELDALPNKFNECKDLLIEERHRAESLYKMYTNIDIKLTEAKKVLRPFTFNLEIAELYNYIS